VVPLVKKKLLPILNDGLNKRSVRESQWTKMISGELKKIPCPLPS